MSTQVNEVETSEEVEETAYEAAMVLEETLKAEASEDEENEVETLSDSSEGDSEEGEESDENADEGEEDLPAEFQEDEDSDEGETTEDENHSQDDTFDAKFDDLLNKERALRERETVVKTAEDSGLNMESMAKLARSNPVEFLKQFNVTYDEITDSILDEHTVDPKMKSLEDRLSVFEKAEQTRVLQSQQADVQTQVDKYVNDLHKHIEDSEYELIKAMGSEQLVLDTISTYYRQNNSELDVDEACKQVEKYLHDTELPKMERLMNTSKAQSVFKDKELPAVMKKSQTLSNKKATSAPRRKTGKMSREDVVNNAYLLEEQLKRNT